MTRLLIAGILAAGCGRVGFEPSPGEFAPPSPIAELNTDAIEGDPALTADLLEMYFDSDRAGQTSNDIWVTTRAATTDPWGEPTLVPELSSQDFDGGPGVTPDGLEIYISSNRPGGMSSFDLWVSKRESRTSPWNLPTFVAELSSSEDDSNAQPEQSRLVIWFASARSATARRLYRATRASPQEAWSSPVLVDELDAGRDITTADPSLRADGRELFFATNRPGGLGANDLWRAERTSASGTFGAPEPVLELSSIAGDIDPWLSADGRFIVFTSRREGSEDLYSSTR